MATRDTTVSGNITAKSNQIQKGMCNDLDISASTYIGMHTFNISVATAARLRWSCPVCVKAPACTCTMGEGGWGSRYVCCMHACVCVYVYIYMYNMHVCKGIHVYVDCITCLCTLVCVPCVLCMHACKHAAAFGAILRNAVHHCSIEQANSKGTDNFCRRPARLFSGASSQTATWWSP